MFVVVLIILVLIVLWKYCNKVDYLYIKNFLPTEEFKKVREVCKGVEHRMHKEHTESVNRYKYTFDRDDYISRVFSRNTHKLPGKPSDIPIEYRMYYKGGMMDWHRDTQLYNVPQYEIVYTVDNTSDSETQWIDSKTGKLHSIRSEPNSAFVVRAQGVLHRVTPVNKGERRIIKFAFK